MEKTFNTAGPCQARLHYMLSPLERVEQVRRLVEQELFFVLHAPRQVGKTTSMMALAEELTASGRYAAILVTCEQGVAFKADPAQAERTILASWRAFARRLPEALQPPPELVPATPGDGIRDFLERWARVCPRPIVLFMDEVDALEDAALINLLRQLRAGFPLRPAQFPQSIALVGLRDVRDYKVASGGSERLHTASPFNVKAESITLRNFSHDEVLTLLLQHTEATGQVFEPDALETVWNLTRGQPWLTNALARQLTEVVVPERSQAITAANVQDAQEILIQRRDTHLDSLAERLREERVKRIIVPMLSGELLPDLPEDDVRYVLDLGLMEKRPGQGLVIANPIYAQIIPRVLTHVLELNLGAIRPAWLTPAGQLSLDRLQESFLKFWRQHGSPLLKAAPYAEVAPQLVLMTFLHRVSNGEGRVEREYAIGSGRLDLLLEYKGVRLAVECKVKRPGQASPVKAGLEQLDAYLEGLGWPAGTEDTDAFQAWLFIPEQQDPSGKVKAPRVRTEWRITPEKRKVLVIWG